MARRRRYVYTATPPATFVPPAVLPPPGPAPNAAAAPAVVATAPVKAEAAPVKADALPPPPPPVKAAAQADLAPIEIDDDGVAIIDLTQDDTSGAAGSGGGGSSSSSISSLAGSSAAGSAGSPTPLALNMLLPAKAPTPDAALPSWGKVGGIIGWGGIRVPDLKSEGAAGPPAKRFKSDADDDDGGGSAGRRATADVCYGQFISTIKGTRTCPRTRAIGPPRPEPTVAMRLRVAGAAAAGMQYYTGHISNGEIVQLSTLAGPTAQAGLACVRAHSVRPGRHAWSRHSARASQQVRPERHPLRQPQRPPGPPLPLGVLHASIPLTRTIREPLERRPRRSATSRASTRWCSRP